MKEEETASLGKKNQVLKEELALLKEAHSELTVQFDKLKKELDVIRDGKGIMGLLLGVVKQQQAMSEVLRQVSGKKFGVILPVGPEN